MTSSPARPADGIAWVTGASAGIGRAVVLQLVEDGWTVAVTARRPDKLAELAAGHPGRIIAAPGDVTDPDAMRAAIAGAEAETGRRLALLVVNAGTFKPMDADDFDLGSFTQQVEINLIGAGNTIAAAVPGLIARRKGQVAVVASVAGYFGMPTNVAYGATKAGLIAMTESLKFSLDRYGVKTTLICPGFVKTPLTDKNEFPMPFLMEVGPAAKLIVGGLASSRFEVNFPRQLSWPMKIMRLLPYAPFFWLLRRATGSAAERS